MSAPTGATFRAIWPITDESMTLQQLKRQASDELPRLLAQARARITWPGTFRIDDSANVPGSGRVTELVLVYEAPAEPMPRRAYHRSEVAA